MAKKRYTTDQTIGYWRNSGLLLAKDHKVGLGYSSPFNSRQVFAPYLRRINKCWGEFKL